MKNNININQQWHDHKDIYVIDPDGLGMVKISNWIDNETWISNLYVDEDHRRQGIATRLLDEAEKFAEFKPIHISVEVGSPKWLEEFYNRRGYKVELSAIIPN